MRTNGRVRVRQRDEQRAFIDCLQPIQRRQRLQAGLGID